LNPAGGYLQINEGLESFGYNLPVFTSIGTYQTLPGTDVNTGTLTITGVPEPSTVGLVLAGIIAASLRRRPLKVASFDV
jgi:hypothetical protein